MTLQSGSLLQGGKYRIVRVLGQGGFGITYLAEQVALGRQVAIKEFFMKEMCGRDAETSHVTLGTGAGRETVQRFREKFLKEARNIASLDHPGIVRIYDVFEENGTAYYVMEYLRGGSLKAMTEKHPLSEVVAVEMVRHVADALAYIHSRHMLHLDVKPSNILLRKVGEQPVLIDFGISKHYDAQGEQTTTMQAGISKGYAPMEQYSQEMQAFTPSTDIYSLGATLYTLLTGQTPPDASLLLNDESLPSFYPKVSSRTWHVVLQCMQPRRKDRPQSIPQFLRLFENEAEDDTVIIDTEGPRSAPSRPANKPQASKWWAWALIAILFGGIGYGAMRWMGHGETEGAPLDSLAEGETAQEENVVITYADGVRLESWTGKLDNAVPVGSGIATYPADDKDGRKEYRGAFVDGMRDGADAVLTFTNGDVYEGSFKRDMYATGTLTLREAKMHYEGTFSRNQPYNGTWYDDEDGSVYSQVKYGTEEDVEDV